MNGAGNEGVSLAKMAVAALLCTLLVGAIVTMFYVFLNMGDQKFGKEKKEIESVNMEKLYTLQDQSLSADAVSPSVPAHPLVQAVTATLLEHAEHDMVYIYVTCRVPTATGYTYRGSYIFTYKNVIFNSGVLNSLPGYSAGVRYFYGDTIIPTSTKYIQQWAKERCHISIGDVPYGGNNLLGICIEILEE